MSDPKAKSERGLEEQFAERIAKKCGLGGLGQIHYGGTIARELRAYRKAVLLEAAGRAVHDHVFGHWCIFKDELERLAGEEK